MVSDDDLLELRQSKGKYSKTLSEMCKFYRDWHVKSDGVHGNCCLYFHYLAFCFIIFFIISSEMFYVFNPNDPKFAFRGFPP